MVTIVSVNNTESDAVDVDIIVQESVFSPAVLKVTIDDTIVWNQITATRLQGTFKGFKKDIAHTVCAIIV